MLSWFLVGPDGNTPYERQKLKPFVGEICDFGSDVYYATVGDLKGGSLEPRWYEGVWLGKHLISGEHIIASRKKNIVKTASIRLKTTVELADPDLVVHLFGITGTPWNLSGTTDGNEEPTVIELLPPSEVDQTDDDSFETRGFHIKREILGKSGFTLGCAKCTAMRRGESKR